MARKEFERNKAWRNLAAQLFLYYFENNKMNFIKEFPKEAEQIMISTYQALANRDKRKLLGLVTEMMFTV